MSKLEKRGHVEIKITRSEQGTERKIYPIDKIVMGGKQKCEEGITKKNIGHNKKEYHNSKPNNKPIIKDNINGNKELPLKSEPSFSEFWEAYKYKKNKKAAQTSWKKITSTNKEKAIAAIPHYLTSLNKTGYSQCHASSWLNGERWNDDHSPQKTLPTTKNLVDNVQEDQAKILFQCFKECYSSSFERKYFNDGIHPDEIPAKIASELTSMVAGKDFISVIKKVKTSFPNIYSRAKSKYEKL
jgi:hypothetical protein